MFDYLANPARFMRIADRLFWPLVVIATGLIGAGLYYGLLNSPPDYQQGETVRIMYVHVPAAWIATLGYVALGLCGLFYICLLYTSPSPRDQRGSGMPGSA